MHKVDATFPHGARARTMPVPKRRAMLWLLCILAMLGYSHSAPGTTPGQGNSQRMDRKPVALDARRDRQHAESSSHDVSRPKTSATRHDSVGQPHETLDFSHVEDDADMQHAYRPNWESYEKNDSSGGIRTARKLRDVQPDGLPMADARLLEAASTANVEGTVPLRIQLVALDKTSRDSILSRDDVKAAVKYVESLLLVNHPLKEPARSSWTQDAVSPCKNLIQDDMISTMTG